MAGLVSRLRIIGGLSRPSTAGLHIEDRTMMKPFLTHDCDSSLHFALEAGVNQFTSNSAELDIMDYQDLPNEEVRQLVLPGSERVVSELDESLVPPSDLEQLETVQIPVSDRTDTHNQVVAFDGDVGSIVEMVEGIKHYSALMEQNREE